MKEQYYKPELSDIYIGYELEYCPDVFKKDNEGNAKFIKEIYTGQDFTIRSLGKIYDINDLIQTSLIKVPYLTKKQIESLKWKYIEEDVCSDLLKDSNTLQYQMLIFKYKKYKLWWINELKQIHLGILDSDGYFNTHYKGTCKSINEFRYLMKLLNIK